LQVDDNILILADSICGTNRSPGEFSVAKDDSFKHADPSFFSSFFWGRTMSVIFPRLEQALLSSVTATSAILRFGFPATIFTLFGFARLTNVREAFSAAFICSVMACLSWAAGRVVRVLSD
jgi:hypothetical protein